MTASTMVPLFALLLGLVAIPYATFRMYASRVETADTPLEERMHRLRRAQQAGYFLLPLVGVPSIIALDVPDRASTLASGLAVGPPIGPILEEALAFGAIFVAVTLPITAVLAATHPAERRLRETSASFGRVLRGMLLGIGSVVAPIVVWMALTAVLPESVTGSPIALIGVLGIFVVLLWAVTPYTMLFVSDRVPLEGDRRRRVENLCEELGFSPRGVYLLEGESTKAANAMVAGTIPGRRYVFLTDYLVAEADDAELRAILAHEWGHVAGNHLWQRGVVTVAVFGSYLLLADILPLDRLGNGLQADVLSFLLVVSAFVLYYVVILGALSLIHEYRADAFATAQAGTEETAAAIELLADANDARRDTGLLYSLLTHHPSITERLDAIQED